MTTALPGSIAFIERDWLSANHIMFRDGDGNELSGTAAPRVQLTFSGPTDDARLLSCVLSDPQMGRAVDCTARADAALKAQKPRR